MALTSWNNILNKPKGVDNIEEIALTVEQLSASVLSISEDVGEIALDVSQLSASVLSISEAVDNINVINLSEVDFTWDTVSSRFQSNNTITSILNGKTLISMYVYSTNNTALRGLYITGTGKLLVFGNDIDNTDHFIVMLTVK